MSTINIVDWINSLSESELKDQLVLAIDGQTPTKGNSADKASLSELGSMASQDSDDVDITGGAINGVLIGNNAPSEGNFSNVTVEASNQSAEAKAINIITYIRTSSGVITLNFPSPYNQGQTALSGVLIATMRQNNDENGFAVRSWRVASNFSSGLSFQEIGTQENASAGGSTPSWGNPSVPTNGSIRVSCSWTFTPAMSLHFQGAAINRE